MSNEAKVVFDPDQTDLWFVILKDDGGTIKARDVVNTAWDVWNDADIDDYDTALAEAALGAYFGDVPAAAWAVSNLTGWTDDEYMWIAYQGLKDNTAVPIAFGTLIIRDEAVVLLDTSLSGVVEGSVTVVEALRLMLSILTAKSSGGGTNTLAFRDIADSKNRLVCTVDANGNRTAVGTRDGS